MAKKDSAKGTAATFAGTEKQVQFDVPKGYKLVREPKTARMQLLVREDTKAAVKRAADACGVSLNEMANRILDAWADQQPDESEG